jgi:hypothetical protein
MTRPRKGRSVSDALMRASRVSSTNPFKSSRTSGGDLSRAIVRPSS